VSLIRFRLVVESCRRGVPQSLLQRGYRHALFIRCGGSRFLFPSCYTTVRVPLVGRAPVPYGGTGGGTMPEAVPSRSGERPADGARRPISFGLVGPVGVCGLLPDGYHYSLDIRG